MAETIIDWINKNKTGESIKQPSDIGAIYVPYSKFKGISKAEFIKEEKGIFAPSLLDDNDVYAYREKKRLEKEAEALKEKEAEAQRAIEKAEKKKKKDESNKKSAKGYLFRKPDGTFHKNLSVQSYTGQKGGKERDYVFSKETNYLYSTDTEKDPLIRKYKIVDGKIALLTEADKASKESLLKQGTQQAGYSWVNFISSKTANVYDKNDPSKKIGTYVLNSGKILDLEGKKLDFSKTPEDPEIEGKGIPTSQYHRKKEELLLYPFTPFFPDSLEGQKYLRELTQGLSDYYNKYCEWFDENGNIYIQSMKDEELIEEWNKIEGANIVDMVNKNTAKINIKTISRYDYEYSFIPETSKWDYVGVSWKRPTLIIRFEDFVDRIKPLLRREVELGTNIRNDEGSFIKRQDAIVKYNESEPEYDLYKAPNFRELLCYLNRPSGLVYSGYPKKETYFTSLSKKGTAEREIEDMFIKPSYPSVKDSAVLEYISFIPLVGFINPRGDVVIISTIDPFDEVSRIVKDSSNTPARQEIQEQKIKKQNEEIDSKINEFKETYKKAKISSKIRKTQQDLSTIGEKAKKTTKEAEKKKKEEDDWVDEITTKTLGDAENMFDDMRTKDYNANKRLKRAYNRNVSIWKEQHPDDELRRIYRSGQRTIPSIDITKEPSKAPPKAPPKAKAPVEHIRLEIAEPEAPPPKNLVINRRRPPAEDPPPPADPEPEPAQPIGGVRCKEILGQQSTCLDKQVGKPTMEKLSRVSNFKTVQRKANQLLGDRFEGKVPLELSTRSGKKYMIGIPGTRRKVHFGDLIREDFTKHKNQKRLNDFRRRNAKWANASWDTPMWLSYNLLW